MGSRLKDKVAVITGGAYGIGRAFCLGLAGEGATVVVADIAADAGEALAKEIETLGGRAVFMKTDVAEVEDTLQTAKKTVDSFGRIDVLINNAAEIFRTGISQGSFYEITPEEWDRVMAVNLKGPFLCTRAVFPYMKEQGGGRIINLASGTFFSGPPVMSHYVASKGGVIGLTRCLAAELGKYNINVNCIAPGRTFSEDADNQAALEINEQRALFRSIKRVEYPQDLVGAAIFFASPDSDFITGQTLVVDGGDVKH